MNQEAFLFSLLIPESYLQAKPFDLVADMSEQIHNLPVQFSFIMRTSGIFLAVHVFVHSTSVKPAFFTVHSPAYMVISPPPPPLEGQRQILTVFSEFKSLY